MRVFNFLFVACVIIIAIMVLLSVHSYMLDSEFKARCTSAGGVPVIVQNERMCFASNAYLRI